MENDVYVDDRYILALARSLALKGLPVPGASEELLVLSDLEHADNLEAALKSQGLWTCPPIWHCCNSTKEVQDECRKQVASIVPLRSKRIGGVALTRVTFKPPLEDGSTQVYLYLKAPKGTRKLSDEQLRDRRWTTTELQELKRPTLMRLANLHGVKGCNSRSNVELRKELAHLLVLR